jgi:organic hydroperoxide reductase OsmC/OhrA
MLSALSPASPRIMEKAMEKQPAQFDELSKKAKEGCPVSKVLNAKISLDATLVN